MKKIREIDNTYYIKVIAYKKWETKFPNRIYICGGDKSNRLADFENLLSSNCVFVASTYY